MRGAFIFFLLGVVVGGFAIHAYDESHRGDLPPAGHALSAPSLSATRESVSSSAEDIRQTISSKLQQWHLMPDDIKDDLAKTGKVVRENAERVGGKISDARIIAVIKAKYVLDNDLSARDIGIESVDGVVTLRGSVATAELLGRAVALALDTEGVHNVTAQVTVGIK